MKGTVAITDFGWYQTLSERRELTEVNFWTPSAHRAFRGEENAPFFFKLRSPHDAICGFGFFSRYSRLPDWLAWECFEIGNGCQSLAEMRARIRGIRERTRYRGNLADPLIGCLLILAPVFFPEDQWVRQPANWRSRTQANKGYDLSWGEGRRVWDECQARARSIGAYDHALQRGIIVETRGRYGNPVVVRPRLGQGTFRVAVTEAYDWGCAVTDEYSLTALDAAHIRPFEESGPHAVENGLLLRADLHRLL